MTGHVFATGGPGQDTLTYHAQGQPVAVTPSTIAIGGTERVAHTTFEAGERGRDPSGQLPQVTIVTPTANPSTTSAVPFISLAAPRRTRMAASSP